MTRTFAVGTLILLIAVGTVIAHVSQPAQPQTIMIYSDALVGPGVTFSAGFDATQYKLVGEPKLWAKEQYSPIAVNPTTKWIQCANSNNANGTNCGPGKVNIFFYSQQDNVGANSSPWGQVLTDGKWMVTAQALPPSSGQAWRVRIELDIVAK